ncbi:hypothetical protein ABT282_07910 [Streptomyces sp. NPDC000927]|uniref:hypothetical protein n=1 Tax=Streptomyces sp. NPDC000927 TaxID=3154371 RepID=UPI003323E445
MSTAVTETPTWGPGADPAEAALATHRARDTTIGTVKTEPKQKEHQSKVKETLSNLKSKLLHRKKGVAEGEASAEVSPGSSDHATLHLTLTPGEDGTKQGGEPAKGSPDVTQRAAQKVKKAISPKAGHLQCFVWASATSWVIGPQTAIAAYERISGHPYPSDWGLLLGPGRWVRDMVKWAWESGHMPSLWMAVILGLGPMLVMSVPQSILSTKSMAWIVGIGFAVYFTGSAEYYHLWEKLQEWQLFLAALVALAYYCTLAVFKRRNNARAEIRELHASGASDDELSQMSGGADLAQVVLLIPVASICCAVLYAPGAAF